MPPLGIPTLGPGRPGGPFGPSFPGGPWTKRKKQTKMKGIFKEAVHQGASSQELAVHPGVRSLLRGPGGAGLSQHIYCGGDGHPPGQCPLPRGPGLAWWVRGWAGPTVICVPSVRQPLGRVLSAAVPLSPLHISLPPFSPFLLLSTFLLPFISAKHQSSGLALTESAFYFY